MLTTRIGKASSRTGVTRRMKPASTTMSTPCARSTSTTAASNAARSGYALWSTTTVGDAGGARALEAPARRDVRDDDARPRASRRAGGDRRRGSAWRFVPLPETSTPRTKRFALGGCRARSIDALLEAPCRRRRARPRRGRRAPRRATASASRRARRRRPPATTTTKPTPRLKVRRISASSTPALRDEVEDRRALPRRRRGAAPRPSGRTRGRLPGRPPPVMWLIACTSTPAREQRLHVARVEARRHEERLADASRRRAPRARSAGDSFIASRSTARERVAVRVQAARRRAPITTSPAATRLPSTIFSRATTPTAKPARSYSPAAYMPGSSAVSPPRSAQPRLLAAVGDALRPPSRRRRRRACRWRSSRGRRAAARRS